MPVYLHPNFYELCQETDWNAYRSEVSNLSLPTGSHIAMVVVMYPNENAGDSNGLLKAKET